MDIGNTIVSTNILVREEVRPVWYECRGKQQRALFHRWFEHKFSIQPSKKDALIMQGSELLAVIELENGEALRVNPKSIRFVDGGEFSEFIWPEEIVSKE